MLRDSEDRNSACGSFTASRATSKMAIRWDQFPHQRIRLEIYARLALRILHVQRGFNAAYPPGTPTIARHGGHQRYIELEAREIVEHLRSARDVYRKFIKYQGCRPVLEAQWVVLRFAVLPTAVSVLRQRVFEYAQLSKVPGSDLSLLFGVLTRSCYRSTGEGCEGFRLLCLPDLEDNTPATTEELESLSKLVDEDSLLIFEDIRDEGGAVFRLHWGGPFSVDDRRAVWNSFGLGGLHEGMTLLEWIEIRERFWNLQAPWTEGLRDLFMSVQEELMSQWRALPSDSLLREPILEEKPSGFRSILVASRERKSPEEVRTLRGTLAQLSNRKNPVEARKWLNLLSFVPVRCGEKRSPRVNQSIRSSIKPDRLRSG